MTLTVINAELTRRLLPMPECIDVMAEAMVAASNGSLAIPPRLHLPIEDGGDVLVLMPGSLADIGNYGVKVISAHARNPGRGLPLIQGFVSLFDRENGSPIAIVEGAEITAIRTAATSGLATRLLAREDAKTCGILGTGAQAVTHIDAMCAVRPIEEIIVWGRDPARTRAFAKQQSIRTNHRLRATKILAEAAACDLVCTLTAAPEPLLMGKWVGPGTHVNLVGAHTLGTREADTDLIIKSAVYVDLLESTRNEGGDVMIPIGEGAVTEDHIIGEIGQLLGATIPGRCSADQITLYNSLGISAQDLYAARHVYRRALEEGLGVRIDL